VLDGEAAKIKMPIQMGREGRKSFWVLKSKVNIMRLVNRRAVVRQVTGCPLPEPNHFRKYATRGNDVWSVVIDEF